MKLPKLRLRARFRGELKASQFLSSGHGPRRAWRAFASFLLLATTVLGRAQTSAGGHWSTEVPAGTVDAELRLRIDAPLKLGDQIEIRCSRSGLPLALLLPDEHPVDRESAVRLGFRWHDGGLQPPIGAADGGESVMAEADRPHPAGVYRVVIRGKTAAAVSLSARLWRKMSKEDEHAAMIAATPGAVALPKALVPPGNAQYQLPLEVAGDAGLAFLQIVVPDRSVKVRLAVPDGRLLTESTASAAGIVWGVSDGPPNMSTPMLDLSPVLLPVPGVHHVLTMVEVQKGRYRVFLDTSAARKPAEVRVLYIPLVPGNRGSPERAQLPGAHGVFLRVDAPMGRAQVGDALPIAVELPGASPDKPYRVELAVETRPVVGRTSDGRPELGEPTVERPNMAFAPDENGTLRATVIARKPGAHRFEIKATGTGVDGFPFSADALADGPVVTAVPARLLRLFEQTLDENSNGQPDAWEIRAELEVAEGGTYEMDLGLASLVPDAGSLAPLFLHGSAALQPGRQSLAVTVTSADLWRSLPGDGPFLVENLHIRRATGDEAFEEVDTSAVRLTTTSRPRSDWELLAGEDQAPVHWRGEDRLGTGKAQVLAIDWPVESPGGQCFWSADLERAYGETEVSLPHGAAELPSGRITLPIDVPARLLLPYGSSTWRLSLSLDCFDSGDPVTLPYSSEPFIGFDPKHYEPIGKGVVFPRLPSMRVTGNIAHARLSMEMGAARPKLAKTIVEQAPPELDVQIDDRFLLPSSPQVPPSLSLTVKTKPDTPAGEYAIVLAVEADGVRSRMGYRVSVLR